MSAIAERLICGCATAAQRDCLFSTDVHFIAFGISDFQLAQISAEHIRSGLFNQYIDCHVVRLQNNFDVEQSKCLADSMQQIETALSLFKRDVHQKFIAFNIHHVAEGPIAMAIEIQTKTAVAHAHIADAEVVQELRQ